MARFLKLTKRVSGDPVLVNMDQVWYVRRHERDFSRIVFAVGPDEMEIDVREDLDHLVH